jgi:hypothetical protein
VQEDAFDWIDLTPPRRLFDGSHRLIITSLPALLYARRREVDILGMILVFVTGPQKAHEMHARQATITRQLADILACSQLFRNVLRQFLDDVTQAMNLGLAGNVGRDPA